MKRNGELVVVVDFQRVSPGKGSSFVRTKLKNVKTGKTKEETFKSAETVEFEDVQYKKMNFLYSDGSFYTFMDGISYEQLSMSAADIGDDAKYLKEGLEVIVVVYEGNAIAIQLPLKIEYSVRDAEPAVKGDTASGNVTKEAIMENGLAVRVPIFIKPGDQIVINTTDGSYSERVNS